MTDSGISSCCRLIPPVHHSTLHHKVDLLHHGSFAQQISRHCHNVNQLPCLHSPQRIFHPQQLRRNHCCRTYGLSRSHPKLHHRGKFLRRIHLPVKPSGISPERNLHSRFHRPPKRVLMNLNHPHPHGRALRSASLRHVLPHKNRGYITNPTLCHCFQIFLGNIVPVLDRIHASRNGIMNSVQRHRMRGHFMPLAVRLLDDGTQFIRRERRNIIQHAIISHLIRPVAVHLDPVRPVADLLAHGLPRVVSSIHDLHSMRQGNVRRIPLLRISSRHIKSSRRHLHPGPRDHAVIDR